MVMEVEAIDCHRQAVELHMYIRTGGQLPDAVAPGSEHLVALVLKWSDAEWAANMVDDDRYRWERARQAQKFAELRVIQPRIEAETVLTEACEAGAERRVGH